MRRAVTAVLTAAAVTTTVFLWAPTAGACTAPPAPGPTEEEFLAQADLVFEGVATARHDPNAGAPMQSSGDPIIWTFTVDRQIKGAAAQPQLVQSPRSSATCGMSFEIGTRYRVFAKNVDGVYQTTSVSGTREATLESITTTTTIRPPSPTTTTTLRPARPTRTGRIALTG
ncbi:MAG: hypothetical protein M3O23_11355 [Actinomycetota bacterium]|nr:hypothetical protein [Actinomycetota bacterium]